MHIPVKALWLGVLCAFVFYAFAISATAQEVNYSAFTRTDFDNSICFKKCHAPNTLSPADRPKNIWQILIKDGGHDIFSEISWESPEQKEQVLRYLLDNASNSEPKSEGIGAW